MESKEPMWPPPNPDALPELGRIEPRRGRLEAKILRTGCFDVVTPDQLRKVVQRTESAELARFLLQDPDKLLQYMLSSYNHFGDDSLRELRENGLRSDIRKLRTLGYPGRLRRVLNAIDHFGIRCLEMCFGKEEEES